MTTRRNPRGRARSQEKEESRDGASRHHCGINRIWTGTRQTCKRQNDSESDPANGRIGTVSEARCRASVSLVFSRFPFPVASPPQGRFSRTSRRITEGCLAVVATGSRGTACALGGPPIPPPFSGVPEPPSRPSLRRLQSVSPGSVTLRGISQPWRGCENSAHSIPHTLASSLRRRHSLPAPFCPSPPSPAPSQGSAQLVPRV